ncbi:uncharacterized protein LOC121867042 [Homarus americanus]|uniref:uncharacterized protein LOC121867042 n=1 Tax=Homarus americanus TaxID=6706 RepID=UPI001C43C242|nr:uncharacterized protein LOC121867042 [Homarus americanus]
MSWNQRILSKSLEDLQQLAEHSPVEDDEEITQRMQTTKRMAEAFNIIQQGMQIFVDDDPNRECSSKIQLSIDDRLACYNEIYKERKRIIKQSKLNSYLVAGRQLHLHNSLQARRSKQHPRNLSQGGRMRHQPCPSDSPPSSSTPPITWRCLHQPCHPHSLPLPFTPPIQIIHILDALGPKVLKEEQ